MCILDTFQSGFRTHHSTKSAPLTSSGCDQSLAVSGFRKWLLILLDPSHLLWSITGFHFRTYFIFQVHASFGMYFQIIQYLLSLLGGRLPAGPHYLKWKSFLSVKDLETLIYFASITVILFTLQSVSQPHHTCCWFKMYQEKRPCLPPPGISLLAASEVQDSF